MNALMILGWFIVRALIVGGARNVCATASELELLIVNIFPLRSKLPTSLHLSSNLILSFLRPFDDFRNSAPSIRRSLISVPPPESQHGQFMSSFRISERMLVLLCVPWSGEQALMAVKLFMSSLNLETFKDNG
jgi:hypothetical protein